MCGRYTLTNPAKVFELCSWVASWPQETEARYNIAPGQRVMMVAGPEPYAGIEGRWGLTGKFSGRAKTPGLLINARRETVLLKPMFQRWFRTQRCLIPADGFYEWPADKRVGRGSAGGGPFYFVRQDGRPFAFAGFFASAIGSDGQAERQCVILTKAAAGPVATIHPRMPVIVSPTSMQAYLQCAPEDAVLDRLSIDANEDLRMYRVGTGVNRSGWDDPGCILPVAEPSAREADTKDTLF